MVPESLHARGPGETATVVAGDGPLVHGTALPSSVPINIPGGPEDGVLSDRFDGYHAGHEGLGAGAAKRRVDWTRRTSQPDPWRSMSPIAERTHVASGLWGGGSDPGPGSSSTAAPMHWLSTTSRVSVPPPVPKRHLARLEDVSEDLGMPPASPPVAGDAGPFVPGPAHAQPRHQVLIGDPVPRRPERKRPSDQGCARPQPRAPGYVLLGSNRTPAASPSPPSTLSPDSSDGSQPTRPLPAAANVIVIDSDDDDDGEPESTGSLAEKSAPQPPCQGGPLPMTGMPYHAAFPATSARDLPRFCRCAHFHRSAVTLEAAVSADGGDHVSHLPFILACGRKRGQAAAQFVNRTSRN